MIVEYSRSGTHSEDSQQSPGTPDGTLVRRGQGAGGAHNSGAQMQRPRGLRGSGLESGGHRTSLWLVLLSSAQNMTTQLAKHLKVKLKTIYLSTFHEIIVFDFTRGTGISTKYQQYELITETISKSFNLERGS